MNIKEYLESKELDPIISGNNWIIDCPFCEDNRRRCGIHQESGQWNCFNCEERGLSMRSFQKKMKDERVQELKLEKPKKDKTEIKIDQSLSDKYFKRLKKNDRAALTYLTEERGFSKPTVKHFQLGSLKKNGFEYVSIPFWKRGKLVNLKYRAINYTDKKWKWIRQKGGESSLFHDDMIEWKEYENVHILEAELDCVALYNAGIKNVIAVTTGAKAFKQEWYDRLLRFKKIYLVYDTDVDGQLGAAKAAKRLGLNRCYNVKLPDKYKDVNDFFWDKKGKKSTGNTKKEFQKIVKDARQFQIKNIISLRDAYKDLHKFLFTADEEELIGFQTQWPKFNKLFGGAKPGHLVVVTAAPKIGKCLKYDSLIVDPKTGLIITIEQAVKSKLEYAFGYDEKSGQLKKVKISDWYDSGIQPHLKITTKIGTAIETTYHHPFLTFSGWKNADELKVGDHIAIPKHIPIFGNVSWSKERCFILGSLLADGGLTGGSVSWTKSDSKIVRKMKSFVQKEFGLDSKIQPDCITYRFSKSYGSYLNNPLKSWLDDMGCLVLSKDKNIPSEVFSLNRECLAEFISALWSGDGSIHEEGIEYSSASKDLIYGLKHILQRFGILMRVEERITSCKGKNFISYRISSGQTVTINKFQKLFTLTGSKNVKLKNLCKELNKSKKLKRDYLTTFPKEVWGVISGELKKQNMNFHQLGIGLYGKSYGFKKEGGCSIFMLKKINEFLRSPVLRNWINSEVCFVKITDISKSGDHQCYDLTVPETSNFIANDILVHNTTWVFNWFRHLGFQGTNTLIYECEMRQTRMAEKSVVMHVKDFDYISMSSLNEIHLAEAWYGNPIDQMFLGYPKEGEFTLDTVCEQIEESVQRYGIRLVCFDNLHYLVRGDNVRDRIGEITRRFKILAERLDIVFVLIAHPRKTYGKAPTADDLKDSSSIYQDLDTLVILHREIISDEKNVEKEGQYDPMTTLTVKGRWTEGGQTELYFDGGRSLFFDTGSKFKKGQKANEFRKKNKKKR